MISTSALPQLITVLLPVTSVSIHFFLYWPTNRMSGHTLSPLKPNYIKE
uniref:Uncharacterized protein n=1 Tax=Anguilla anguilla TaxID=7936 RepID=A0A0E9QS53_ANGAN